MRAQLKGKNKIQFTQRDVTTHTNVFRHVILGYAAIGGSNIAALNKEPQGVISQLKIIYKTQELPSHPLVAHPRIPEKIRQAVIDAVLKLAEDTEDQDMLKKVRLSRPMKVYYKRDYLPLERLELERYLIIGGE
ncbi:MAG: PhnD/SsuA/transferrin family substrate-binding protein [Nitrospirae bacterium]|nr:PhnD/SsuA/transferrin family substrate-binding protein [Nitrospirota bacterium]MBI3378402.1 PhnD/SsuA/transferrin family substrate-binding protein [Nitrospirota bacterium]